MQESKSLFLQLNKTDYPQIDEFGRPLEGDRIYIDESTGEHIILRFIHGFLNGDSFDENGNFLMQNPAVEGGGHLEYWRNNKLHRDDDEPAVITNGFRDKEWWENGERKK